MPRVVEFDSRRRDSHPLQSEAYGDRPMYRRAVLRSNDVNLGIRGRRSALLRRGEGRNQGDAQREK